MNVFEINDAIKSIREKDIDPELLQDTLESLEATRAEKMDGVASWIADDESKLNWLDEKIKQLTALKKHYKKETENLNGYLSAVLNSSGHESIQTENNIFRLGRRSEKVIVPDVEQIPIDYVKRTEKLTADKKAIKAAIKSGKEVPGAYLEKNRKLVIE